MRLADQIAGVPPIGRKWFSVLDSELQDELLELRELFNDHHLHPAMAVLHRNVLAMRPQVKIGVKGFISWLTEGQNAKHTKDVGGRDN